MKLKICTLFFCLLFLCVSAQANHSGDKVVFEAADVPTSGCLVIQADFSSLLRWYGIPEGKFAGVDFLLDGKAFPGQFIPVDSAEKGMVAFKFSPELVEKSKQQNIVIELKFLRAGNELKPITMQDETKENVQIVRPDYVVSMNSKKGGFPDKIKFTRSGQVCSGFMWYDRLHHVELGGWNLSEDKDARLAIVSDGPVCTVVRQSARFLNYKKSEPASKPHAVYHWLYFKGNEPLVYVSAQFIQEEAFAWRELHFAEFHPNGQFPSWAASSRLMIAPTDKRTKGTGKYNGSGDSVRFKHAGAVCSGSDAIAMFATQLSVYDGKNKISSYLLADPGFAWTVWDQKEVHNACWLRLGELKGEAPAVNKALDDYAASLLSGHMTLKINKTKSDTARWLDSAATTALVSGGVASASEVDVVSKLKPFAADGKYVAIESGDLGMLLARQKAGDSESLGLLSLVDRKTFTTLTAGAISSLFTIDLRDLKSEKKESLQVSSLTGWKKIDVQSDAQARSCRMTFAEPTLVDPAEAKKISVVITCTAQQGAGLDLSLEFISDSKRYSLMKTVFPSVNLCSLGRNMKAFYPTGPGLVFAKPIENQVNQDQLYPSGFGAPMAWMASWDKSTDCGLYFGFHDPDGTPKTLRLKGNDPSHSLLMEYEHPTPNMTLPANSCVVPGVAHLQALHGDWFDAACMYRGWVRAHAKWYPKPGPEGRTDTPDWMKKLCLWCITGGPTDKMPGRMKAFKEAFGVPGACHWYNWHVIRFDNDYPHFLPSLDGFKEAVLEIQKDGDFVVMPYINGRLWDTHDRDTEDWQFTKLAKPFVSKQEDGSPKVESYHSKEKDGNKVVLGAMCPYTKFWQDKQRQLVLRLMNEEHVQAVYLDQISASRTTLCMDPTHGHALGGGNWWLTGYWQMLSRIRTDMKREVADYPLSPEEKSLFKANPNHLKNRVLTSECNSETYAHVLDGFLTWHWQYQDAVPAFSTVYGGGVTQMFGRAYAGNDAAWRMKAAESLVFGEQIGWFNDSVVKNVELMKFLRQVVRMRFHRIDYFFKGELARPVSWLDTMPTMTEDWKWSGQEKIITADAVRTGTLRLCDFADRQKGKTTVKSAIILFANASDQNIKSRIGLNLSELGFAKGSFELRKVDSEGKSQVLPATALTEPFDFPGQSVFALELLAK
ncbi:MAG: DUF6259 domain-containing protein [Thermoguttaceae bacterium]|nr:DUF6259 domain-containing protein [Thermoguttaceae bacterium]